MSNNCNMCQHQHFYVYYIPSVKILCTSKSSSLCKDVDTLYGHIGSEFTGQPEVGNSDNQKAWDRPEPKLSGPSPKKLGLTQLCIFFYLTSFLSISPSLPCMSKFCQASYTGVMKCRKYRSEAEPSCAEVDSSGKEKFISIADCTGDEACQNVYPDFPICNRATGACQPVGGGVDQTGLVYLWLVIFSKVILWANTEDLHLETFKVISGPF